MERVHFIKLSFCRTVGLIFQMGLVRWRGLLFASAVVEELRVIARCACGELLLKIQDPQRKTDLRVIFDFHPPPFLRMVEIPLLKTWKLLLVSLLECCVTRLLKCSAGLVDIIYINAHRVWQRAQKVKYPPNQQNNSYPSSSLIKRWKSMKH